MVHGGADGGPNDGMKGEPPRQEVDQETFRRFQGGDHGATLAIVETYHRRVLAFLRVRLGDGELAEDIAQETFLRLLESRGKLHGAPQLCSWLFTVANRLAIRESQLRSRLRPDEDESNVVDPKGPPLGEQLQHQQRDAILFEAMACLGQRDTELLTLRYFGRLSIKQLSETLGMPMGSVGVSISRAHARMRKWLEENGHHPEDLL